MLQDLGLPGLRLNFTLVRDVSNITPLFRPFISELTLRRFCSPTICTGCRPHRWVLEIFFLSNILKAHNTHIVVVAFLSDRLKWRGPFILICLPLAIIGRLLLSPLAASRFVSPICTRHSRGRTNVFYCTGYILAITAETNSVRYIAVFFMAAGV